MHLYSKLEINVKEQKTNEILQVLCVKNQQTVYIYVSQIHLLSNNLTFRSPKEIMIR